MCGYNGYTEYNKYNEKKVGTVEKCYNEGTVIGYTKIVGGVCGLNGSDCKTTNCYNIGAVTGFGGKVGGVCGYNSGNIEICYNTGTVTGAGEYAGGVCGQKYAGTIIDCYYLEGTASGGINGADASVMQSFMRRQKLLLVRDILTRKVILETITAFSHRMAQQQMIRKKAVLPVGSRTSTIPVCL